MGATVHEEVEALRRDLRDHAAHLIPDAKFQANVEVRLHAIEKRSGRQAALVAGLAIAAAAGLFGTVVQLFGG